ncbi:hypothetical protein CDD81_6876 [Ophiocordyceps australis]|uniref:Guanine nucleotide-exchange factor SEC12 n=1 Tax=Ophiocordyceps australis TaxID=1399860 RepID=A0A2C5Y6R4_9HYPO|nr:hypothetical protein CDD81_6876 [Ophiocordyceps australis]
MAPKLNCVRLELNYPLYASDFDPRDASRLVVGGGGGSSRFGATNKITVLHLSPDDDDIQVAGELQFSSDDDSVMSLAVGPVMVLDVKGKGVKGAKGAKGTKGVKGVKGAKGTKGAKGVEEPQETFAVLAGVNENTVSADENNHLRVLAVTPEVSRSKATKDDSEPSSETIKVSIRQCAQKRTFENADANAYQRLLRVKGHFAAAASAMGSHHEHSVMKLVNGRPANCVNPVTKEDIEDLDLWALDADNLQLVYCYRDRLEMTNFNLDTLEAPKPLVVYNCKDDGFAFRAVRYLTSHFALCVGNLPRRSGVVIQAYRLPLADKKGSLAKLAIKARISRNISATALAVTSLTPGCDCMDNNTQEGDAQFIIAIAGSDSSIHLFTLEYRKHHPLHLLSHLKPLCTLENVFDGANISGLSFSTFVHPTTHMRVQSVRLASTALTGAVAVHTIPLKKAMDWNLDRDKGPARAIRYSVAMRSRLPSSWPLLTTLALIFLLMAIVWQGVMEVYGQREPIIFAQRFLPSWHGTLRAPDGLPGIFSHKGVVSHEDERSRFMSKILGDAPLVEPAGRVIVFESSDEYSSADGEQQQPSNIRADLHDEAVHGPAQTWEQLGEEQKVIWRQRLREAGAWTQGMGESVFKGILFGQIAGAIGNAVAA